MESYEDLTGKTFNNLKVIKFAHVKNTHAIWVVQCLKCKKQLEVTASNLKSGNSNSCGSCGQRKFSNEEELDIKKEYVNSEATFATLAEKYKVSRTTIHNIIHRKGN